MPKKRYNAEEIIQKLRGADVLLSQGKSVSQAGKQIGVSDLVHRYLSDLGAKSGLLFLSSHLVEQFNFLLVVLASPTRNLGRQE